MKKEDKQEIRHLIQLLELALKSNDEELLKLTVESTIDKLKDFL